MNYPEITNKSKLFVPYVSTFVGAGFKDYILDIIEGEIILENLSNREIFEQIYDINVKNKNWKERTENEKQKISEGYLVFKLNGEIIGGCYLKLQERNFQVNFLLECVWIDEKLQGSGYGSKAMDKIKSFTQPCQIITYTKKGGFFEKCGFKKVEGDISETGAQKYIFGQ